MPRNADTAIAIDEAGVAGSLAATSRVGRLPFAVGLARSATRVIRQNLVISLGE